MQSLEDKVREVVDSFIDQSVLFTALDVSNEVKKTFPLARHREIRDVVRALFADMRAQGYGRTPIAVTLADGRQETALLYHHLSDSWDLDTRYDTQQRSQTTVRVVPSNNPAPAHWGGALPPVASTKKAITVQPQVQKTVVVSNPPAPPVVVKDPQELWDNLFSGVNLFPTNKV